MKKNILFNNMINVLIITFLCLSCVIIPTNKIEAVGNTTPVERHGQLSVKGTDIVDKNGEKFQLRGISTHGIAWFPQYVNQEAFNYMRDEWKINTIRLAMYSAPECGYNDNTRQLVKQGVEYAKNAGLYVIIDWHILSDNNPNTYKAQAIEFFKEMATLYKDDANVIYEICNEPNGDVQWERDIKPYAEEVIREIRNIDNDAIIVVGTPTWSQDVDVVAQSPITGYSNIMYTLHFYAATHKDYLRQKLNTALNSGLPIFVTEFGICDASGNGNLDESEADIWINTLNEKNISWVCWNLSNKNESSAILSSNTSKITGWTDDELSGEGKWLVRTLKENAEKVEVVETKNETQKNTTNNNVIANNDNNNVKNEVVQQNNNVQSQDNQQDNQYADTINVMKITIIILATALITTILLFIYKVNRMKSK